MPNVNPRNILKMLFFYYKYTLFLNVVQIL
jgi:hypothetical protein